MVSLSTSHLGTRGSLFHPSRVFIILSLSLTQHTVTSITLRFWRDGMGISECHLG